jgi:hypothetical protein
LLVAEIARVVLLARAKHGRAALLRGMGEAKALYGGVLRSGRRAW